MIDREKVIDALKRCSYDPDPGQPRKEIFSCSDCPYYRGCYHGCTYDLMRDALALLKEQETRVMTKEEIKSNYVEIFYFETMAGMLRACVKELSDLPDSSIVYLVCGAVDDTYWRDLDGYGITWRAWNRRPSPEQMRDTPWEGGKDAE